jgi:hypothetical protein
VASSAASTISTNEYQVDGIHEGSFTTAKVEAMTQNSTTFGTWMCAGIFQ